MNTILRTLLCAALASAFAAPSVAQRSVTINGERLRTSLIESLEARYNVHVQDGAYWYDSASGAWGFDGQPTVGFIPSGLRVGGALRSDASRGRTAVWVNGRRLPSRDLHALERLTGQVQPGNYWLDGQGNAGFVGGPALVNLAQLSRRSNGLSRSWLTGIGANSSGGAGYVMGSDWSVTTGM